MNVLNTLKSHCSLQKVEFHTMAINLKFDGRVSLFFCKLLYLFILQNMSEMSLTNLIFCFSEYFIAYS